MGKTALIVEDEIFVALDLERILTDAGYTVAAIAADSATALESAPGCQFAFVDINLRDGSTGPQIAQRMVDDFGMKVVFVTANPAQIGAAGRCTTGSGGAALGYIRKPFCEQAVRAAAALASDTGSGAHHEDIVRLPA